MCLLSRSNRRLQFKVAKNHNGSILWTFAPSEQRYLLVSVVQNSVGHVKTGKISSRIRLSGRTWNTGSSCCNGVLYPRPFPYPKCLRKDYGLEVGCNDLPAGLAERGRQANPNGSAIGFFFAHLIEYCVPTGLDDAKKEVRPVLMKAGQIIAKIGHTGNAEGMNSIPQGGAHLHFDVRIKARAFCLRLANRLDPRPYIQHCTNP